MFEYALDTGAKKNWIDSVFRKVNKKMQQNASVVPFRNKTTFASFPRKFVKTESSFAVRCLADLTALRNWKTS